MPARPPSADRRTEPGLGAPEVGDARDRLVAAVTNGARPRAVGWTLTPCATAIVRVQTPRAVATTRPAELTLWTRRRRLRFAERPGPVDAGASPVTVVTFEVPVTMLHRKGLRAQVRVGGVRSDLDWNELARVGPRPAAGTAAVDVLSDEIPAFLRAAVPYARAAAAGAGTGTDGADEAPAEATPEPRPMAGARPVRRWMPATSPLPDAVSARRRFASSAQRTSRATSRAATRGQPQPMARVLAPNVNANASAGASACPAAGGPPPLTVDRALLQFLPYEQAAPRLAVPISLTGDVLTVAVALPSVDLSVITERSPWLRIEREVTGYQRIVQALREVKAMDALRAGALPSDPAGRPARSASAVAAAVTADATPGNAPAGAHRAPLRRDRAATARDEPPRRGWRARRSRRAEPTTASLAFSGRLTAALGRLARDRRGQAAVGAAVASVAGTAVALSLAPPWPGVQSVPARVALDTTTCIGALAAAWLAFACYRIRRSAASRGLVLGLAALALATVMAATGGSSAPPGWRALPAELLLAAPGSAAVLHLAGLALLLAAAIGLAVASRRSDDNLLAWCAAGATSLAAAQVGALLAPPDPASWLVAADLFGLAAIASFLIGGAHELAAHGHRSATAAVVAERRRMARELHDGVAQELAFIVSQASSLARHERPAGPLQSIALAGERALLDSRRSILTLTRPDGSTLREAITEQATQWATRAGLDLELEVADAVQASPEVQHAILRIVQEAISNAVRHSGATKVMVSLAERDGRVTVRICDDGRGFDARPKPEQADGGFGLVSMAERAEASGGQLRLESEPGRGTVVEVAFR